PARHRLHVHARARGRRAVGGGGTGRRTRSHHRAGWPGAPGADARAVRRSRPGRRHAALEVSAAPRIALPHRGWLFDLDGTVYLGEALIPGADEVIAALRADGRRVVFLSNKPLDTRDAYAR